MNKITPIIEKLAIISLTFFTPFVPFVLTVGCFIICDTIAGRWSASARAKKLGLDVRKYVTSKKTRIGVVDKLINYTFALLAVYCMDVFMVNEVVLNYIPYEFATTRIAVLVIGSFELDSIDEKYYNVHGITLRAKIKGKIKEIKAIFDKIKIFKK
jgi:hypothetical protein